jgi:hypothetical protein
MRDSIANTSSELACGLDLVPINEDRAACPVGVAQDGPGVEPPRLDLT